MTDRHILRLAKGAVHGAVVITLGAAVAIACGGGSGDMTGTGGAGTDSGSGGTSNATGGSGNATGGSGNATGGSGNSTGGFGNNTGGSSGDGGDGGLGGANGNSCPATIPDTDDACEGAFNAPTCTYGDQEGALKPPSQASSVSGMVA